MLPLVLPCLFLAGLIAGVLGLRTRRTVLVFGGALTVTACLGFSVTALAWL